MNGLDLGNRSLPLERISPETKLEGKDGVENYDIMNCGQGINVVAVLTKGMHC